MEEVTSQEGVWNKGLSPNARLNQPQAPRLLLAPSQDTSQVEASGITANPPCPLPRGGLRRKSDEEPEKGPDRDNESITLLCPLGTASSLLRKPIPRGLEQVPGPCGPHRGWGSENGPGASPG